VPTSTIKRVAAAAVLLVIAASPIGLVADPIEPAQIHVTDGDTIRVGSTAIRLVGFDAPEFGTHARCDRELELADRATLRLRELVDGGGLDLTYVPCSCRAGTEGTPRCNYGRACAVLTAHGIDVGATLIAEGLARSFVCGPTRCPKRQPWCPVSTQPQ